MSLLTSLILFVLIKETFESGVVFTECSGTQCGGKIPISLPKESSNVSSRMECLVRCLEDDFCSFVGHKEEQCSLYYYVDPIYDMQISDQEWRFWTRPDPCLDMNSPCFNYASCIQHRDTFRCLCTPFYTGERCEKQVDCASSPCQNGASCVMLDEFYCDCPPGFTGTRCEKIIW